MVRLTQIGINAGAKKFAIGEVVEPSEDTGVTADYLAGLVKRGLAEVSHGEGVSAVVAAAIEAQEAAMSALQASIVALVDLGETGSLEDARAVVACFGKRAEHFAPTVDRLIDLEKRVLREERELLARLDQNPAGVSPVAEGEAGSSTPASEGGSVDGRTPPENSAAGATGGPTDTAPEANGADGDAGASAPAEPAAQPTEAKQPARKGGRKSG